MKIPIIILTILYLTLIIVANCITIYRSHTSFECIAKSTGKITKASATEDICRVLSYAVIIIDVAFILAFLF